jgi:hypothetical protein
LLQDEFKAPTLSAQVPEIGGMFESARTLRNDSNYESLILAHQYFHGGTEVNIPDEMDLTARTMSKASLLVLRYMARIIQCAFQDERRWIGDSSPYSGTDLKRLLWRYLEDKIRGANENQPADSTGLPWLDDFPEMVQDVADAERTTDNPAHELIACIRYTVFGGKQSLMRGFQQEASHLEHTVDRISGGEDSQPGLFG